MLLVLAPHRSGTSLTTRMLECLGARNSSNPLRTQPDNPAGFFEDNDVHRFNEDILLPLLGNGWDGIGPLDWGSVDAERHDALRERASAILRRNYGTTSTLCVLKDPRLARLLLFWRSAVEEAGFRCKLVLPVRDPLSVASSLAKRNGLSINHGSLLYLRSWLDIVRDGAALPLAFVLFEEIFEDAESALRRVAQRLGLTLPADFEERVREFRQGHLERALWHHKPKSPHSMHKGGVPAEVVRFYQRLVHAARGDNLEELLQEAAVSIAEMARLNSLLRDYDRRAVEGRRALHDQAQVMKQEKEAALREQAMIMAEEREAALREQARQLTQEAQAALRAKQVQLEEQASRLADLERQIGDILASKSWRITAPLRGILKACQFPRKAWRRSRLSWRLFWQHRRSGLLEQDWYVENNPGIPRCAALLHFCCAGVFRNRAPNGNFDAAFYARHNLDEAASGQSPLLHYALHGFRQGLRCGIFNDTQIQEFTTAQANGPGDTPPCGKPPTTDIRCIAFYLPQFHAIAENDEWWGRGFTEWTNVRRGRPSYGGHYQPHVPHSTLGYYDLNDPGVLEKQAAMARSAGIEGFCFYYYWFGGKRLLEMPTERMLATGRPNIPFCFCWANENWTRRWDGRDTEILIEQRHSIENDRAFIHGLLPAFRDERYIRVDGKPLLLVYRPGLLPDPHQSAETWRAVCRSEGIGEVCLAYVQSFDTRPAEEFGFDWGIQFPPLLAPVPQLNVRLSADQALRFQGNIFDYRTTAHWFTGRLGQKATWPGVFPSWDNTARRGSSAHLWSHTAPEYYFCWLKEAAEHLRRELPASRRLLFINAWNEWAEGCHLEPDDKHGYAWLRATRQALLERSTAGTLDRHPAIAAARRTEVHHLLGASASPEQQSLLIRHTALLSVFHSRGGTLRVEDGSLVATISGKTCLLKDTADLSFLAESALGALQSVPFCFVLLQYNNSAHTQKCVDSIKCLAPRGHKIHIVIVDNASSPQTVAATRRAFENDAQVSFIFQKENLGFSRGNNLGYRLAKKHYGRAFVVAANNDVVFDDPEFLSKCVDLYREQSYSVLGPDILTPDGRHENPWNDYIYSLGEWRDLQVLYHEQRKSYLQSGRADFRRIGKRHPQHALIMDPVLQGACMVFSPIFVETNAQAFDESLFLYGEEFPLAANCLISGHLCLYSNAVAVGHKEAVSTNLIPEQQKLGNAYKGALNGIELAVSRLERHAEAVAGHPMAIETENILKLIADGRRHVLVDLFFCQPGFHGGGEYGKAVFAGLAETARTLPGVQLWAALDPDIFIDDWILEECRRSAINIVRVKSYDDVVKLVNMSAFYSFFAPAIVVYTGYEYMQRLGMELKFDRATKTRVIGTLLDMRDYEMAANWDFVATARKKAGCLPEADLSESQWNSEKSKQADYAQKLAAMYCGICSHESVHTLVTISDYSAQSIRAHAGRSGPIEVLFAPEKSRPEPEPFEWPAIDFKNDPYLVLLNATRVEKNAASTVAAFDALFTEPKFAKANPRLKLVLVGIDNPTDLGIPSPRERARLVAVPYLPPARLEFLLKSARGLLYPSFNEGFGYPPLEAMSLGVPCVVSSQTSIPEVCGNAALYCNPGEIDSIACAIKELLSSPADSKFLRSHAENIRRRQSSDLQKLSELVLGEPPNIVHQRAGWCPVCEKDVRFAANHQWLRDHYICPECGSIPRERAIMRILQERFPNWRNLRIHESSPVGRGSSAKLAADCKSYVHSQFDPELGFGNIHPAKGYRSENLEKQTFAEEAFDLVITQDVMEHVFDVEAAFREIHRTLKPGGSHIFTTPLVRKNRPSQCRATRGLDGSVTHHLTPEYHANPVSNEGSLVTWDWGFDITKIISDAGAGDAEIHNSHDERMGIEGELLEVIVQSKRTSTGHDVERALV